MRRFPSGRMVAALLVFSVVAAACGGGGNDDEASLESTTTTSTSTTTTSTSSTIPAGPFSPFTGLSVGERDQDASAIVVKIGNNNNRSRPQMGLVEADIVFEELVESLKTRFAAIYQSQIPAETGPTRSGRTSDIDLIKGLGTPALAYSGANTTVLGALRRAANDGVMIDIGFLRYENDYGRIDDRPAPYNLWFQTENFLDVEDAGIPTPIFTYGPLPEGMGQPIGGVDVAYPTSAGRQSSHLWDPELGGWVRVQDGTLHTALVGVDEVEIAPANVIVVRLPYGVSPADPASPEAESFGEGPAQIFTRGVEVQGTWSRSEEEPAWLLRDFYGQVVPLERGATWVLLAAGEGSRFQQAEIATFSQVIGAERLADARAEFEESSAS